MDQHLAMWEDVRLTAALTLFRYVLLLERAHAIRAPFKKRLQDWIWVAGAVYIGCGFTAIGVVGFWRPITEISSVDGRCRLGLPRFTIITLVSYDVALDVLLTLVFAYLLSPLICSGQLTVKTPPASRLPTWFGSMCRQSKFRPSLVHVSRTNQQTVKRIERLLLRTFLGSTLVMIPTVGNFVALSVLGGRELGWLCLTVCTFDGTFTYSTH